MTPQEEILLMRMRNNTELSREAAKILVKHIPVGDLSIIKEWLDEQNKWYKKENKK